MNKIFTLILLSAGVLSAGAREIVDGVTVDNFRTERSGDYLSLDMSLGLEKLKVASNQCVLLTPAIVNGNDSIVLPSVAVYGRRRYYYYQRNNGDDMLSGKEEMTFLAKEKPKSVDYSRLLPYAEWMDGAKITLHRVDRGCCSDILLQEYGEIGKYREAFFPELIYVQPKGEIEKRRHLEGQAYIDFPVDQTVIYPDYRSNTVELGRIRATIDTIRDDKDARIDSVWLKGFASPESPYLHNTELAIGRTAALKKYLEQLYHFDNVTFTTDYEPEDWEGLRREVAKSNLDHRAEILELIDSDIEPDHKEQVIKSRYPEEYRFMLQNFYPGLRHTNYKVTYVIRTYNDPEEILKVMNEQPQKLSQNEFYVAANKLEPGTDEFTDVFETAVRMFPEDTVANLNAANAAMRRGDLQSARRYVEKAGDSPEALYARGAIAIRSKDYNTAREYLKKASDAGLEKALATLKELDERTNHKQENK